MGTQEGNEWNYVFLGVLSTLGVVLFTFTKSSANICNNTG